MKKLLISEPMHSGHHTNYLVALVPALRKLREAGLLESVVMVVTARHHALLQAQGHIEAIGDTVTWDLALPETPPAPRMGDRSRLHRALDGVVSAHAPDALVCTSADYDIMPNAWSRFGLSGRRWPERSVGILHYGFPKDALTRKENLKRLVYESAWKLSRWKTLLMVNPLIHENYVERTAGASNRFALLPDPVPAPAASAMTDARRALGLPVGGTLIGCVGMMDKRKAIPELLSAFRTANFSATVRLVLAGRLDQDYRQLVDRDYRDLVSEGRLVVLDRTLSDAELLDGYAAMDLHMVLQYRRFNLSANILKCVAHRKPFVCDQHGYTAMVAERFGAGVTCDVHDPKSIRGAMALGLMRQHGELGSVRTADLIDFHSHANFASTVLAHAVGPEVHAVLGRCVDGRHVYARNAAGMAGVGSRANAFGGAPA